MLKECAVEYWLQTGEVMPTCVVGYGLGHRWTHWPGVASWASMRVYCLLTCLSAQSTLPTRTTLVIRSSIKPASVLSYRVTRERPTSSPLKMAAATRCWNKTHGDFQGKACLLYFCIFRIDKNYVTLLGRPPVRVGTRYPIALAASPEQKTPAKGGDGNTDPCAAASCWLFAIPVV